MVTSVHDLLGCAAKVQGMSRLTEPLGQHLAELPLDPRLGKALLALGDLGCSDEVLTVVALLSVQSIWLSPHGQRRALDAAKGK